MNAMQQHSDGQEWRELQTCARELVISSISCPLSTLLTPPTRGPCSAIGSGSLRAWGTSLLSGWRGLFACDDEASRSMSSINAAPNKGERLMLVLPSTLMVVVLGC